MSFDSLLNRECAIERPYAVLGLDLAPTYDDYNQPIRAYASVTEEVPCAIQSLTGREVPLVSDAGAVIYDHIIFMRQTDLTEADRIHRTDTGEVFEVVSKGDAGGRGHHQEIRARLVTSRETALV